MDSLLSDIPEKPKVLYEVKVKVAQSIRLFVTPWTVARQALLSMGFSRQEYWSGLLIPSPGDLPNPGIPALQTDSLPSELPGKSLTHNMPLYPG